MAQRASQLGPLVAPVSITHQHLLAVVNTECRRRRVSGPLRLLDLGCGDGRLLAYLTANLPRLNPDLQVELHGLDVYDSGVQAPGFFDEARARLEAQAPHVDWQRRLVAVASDGSWPFPPEYFDIVLSNQVLEHVADHRFVFGEIARTLKNDGWSAHLFPLVHYVYEGHLHLPFVHRIRNWDALRAYIRVLSRAGMGKFPQHRWSSGIDVDTFAERHADYMHHLTNYLSYREVMAIAKRAGLRASFRYTGGFYTSKLRSLAGRPAVYSYRSTGALATWTALMMLRYVSSVTLFLEKRFTYRDARH